MLVCSVLVLAAGVCANPNAISRSGTTIDKNALFIGILRRCPPRGGLKFRLGFDSATDSGVEPSGLSGSGVRTWSIQVKPPQSYSARICLSAPNSSLFKGQCSRNRNQGLLTISFSGQDSKKGVITRGRIAGRDPVSPLIFSTLQACRERI